MRERKSHTEEARPCQRSGGGSVKEASINKDSKLNRETDLSEATCLHQRVPTQLLPSHLAETSLQLSLHDVRSKVLRFL